MANRNSSRGSNPRNPSSIPTNNQPSTGYNPVDVHDTPVTEGGLLSHSSGSLQGFLENMLGSGRYDLSSSEFQWLFENYWNLQNAEQSQNWAREDAYLAWLRSLESSKFNAKLGLETSHAGRSQLYQHLIALGMSPMAAMQMLSGSSSGGVSGGSAPMASTQQVQSVSPVGSNQNERINTAINGISTIFSAVSNFGLGIKRLRQDDTHFNKSLDWQKESFSRANWMNDALYSAASSEEFKNFWNNAIKYASTDCPSSALTSPLAFRKHLSSEDGNDILYDEFNALRTKFGWAADSYFDSQFSNVFNSQGQDVYLKLRQENLKQMELQTAIAGVNLKQLDKDFEWLSDKYEDYQRLRKVMNDKNLLSLQWQFERLKMVAGDPDMIELVKKEILSSQEARTFYAEINKVIASGVFEKFSNSEFLEKLLTSKRIFEMCGIDNIGNALVSAGTAVATKGRSLIMNALNSKNDVAEPDITITKYDDYGNEYYYDEDRQMYVPYP